MGLALGRKGKVGNCRKPKLGWRRSRTGKDEIGCPAWFEPFFPRVRWFWRDCARERQLEDRHLIVGRLAVCRRFRLGQSVHLRIHEVSLRRRVYDIRGQG